MAAQKREFCMLHDLVKMYFNDNIYWLVILDYFKAAHKYTYVFKQADG